MINANYNFYRGHFHSTQNLGRVTAAISASAGVLRLDTGLGRGWCAGLAAAAGRLTAVSAATDQAAGTVRVTAAVARTLAAGAVRRAAGRGRGPALEAAGGVTLAAASAEHRGPPLGVQPGAVVSHTGVPGQATPVTGASILMINTNDDHSSSLVLLYL